MAEARNSDSGAKLEKRLLGYSAAAAGAALACAGGADAAIVTYDGPWSASGSGRTLISFNLAGQVYTDGTAVPNEQFAIVQTLGSQVPASKYAQADDYQAIGVRRGGGYQSKSATGNVDLGIDPGPLAAGDLIGPGGHEPQPFPVESTGKGGVSYLDELLVVHRDGTAPVGPWAPAGVPTWVPGGTGGTGAIGTATKGTGTGGTGTGTGSKGAGTGGTGTGTGTKGTGTSTKGGTGGGTTGGGTTKNGGGAQPTIPVGTRGYLGLQFDGPGDSYYYGWADLSIASMTEATLWAYAFEDSGGAIRAGDRGGSSGASNTKATTTPEPGTLSLLALGAVGLAALRRRRQQAASE